MDQSHQPRCNFVAFLSRDKQPGGTKPIFDSSIVKPGTEDEQRFALWPFQHTDIKTGEVLTGFNGQASAIATTAAHTTIKSMDIAFSERNVRLRKCLI